MTRAAGAARQTVPPFPDNLRVALDWSDTKRAGWKHQRAAGLWDSHPPAQWVEVRLWTSLSCRQASARQLIELYARRWEQELFYKQLKLNLRHSELVQSHTPESAEPERLAAAAQSEDGEVAEACAMRVSFAKCRIHMLGL